MPPLLIGIILASIAVTAALAWALMRLDVDGEIGMAKTGGCLCGAVRYSVADGDAIFVGHCHCKDCQKASGAGKVTVLAVPEAMVTITGAMTSYESKGDNGQPVTRQFCPTCGGQLFSRASTMPGVLMIKAGSLDDSAAVAPQMSVFAGSAAAWDQPAAGIPSFAKMPGA